MAGGNKKKKKPTGPARGFATTSLPSKARVEIQDDSGVADAGTTSKDVVNGGSSSKDAPLADATNKAGHAPGAEKQQAEEKTLSPEEFERQLEENELQLLVEKHAVKMRRDAVRQKLRLETDRRLLRGQAEPLNTRKWLPTELLDHILQVIEAENHFKASIVGEYPSWSDGKNLPEEDLTIKLWTLQETLNASGFSRDAVFSVIRFVAENSRTLNLSNKESIWGLDEALEWLARESSLEDLPDYDNAGRKPQQIESQNDTPLASGATTPALMDHVSRVKGSEKHSESPKAYKSKFAVKFDDIEPDQLVPTWLETRTKLFSLQRPYEDTTVVKGKKVPIAPKGPQGDDAKEIKLLRAKLDHIENDVLFDERVAEKQWASDRIILEQDYAAAKKKTAETKVDKADQSDDAAAAAKEVAIRGGDETSINDEAERIAAEILAENNDSDDDDGLGDLFANLPQNEVDPATGKTNNVINGPDGSKTIVRDFGKWTGVTPMRVLEEACRARDGSVKISYELVSEAAWANRHMVTILWNKTQEPPLASQMTEVETASAPQYFIFRMNTIATANPKQSEAFIATYALFHIFGTSSKEEKVSLRLPAVWRDFWAEMAETKKTNSDAKDRLAIKEIRDLVRKKREQELEDGVILPTAFRGRGGLRTPAEPDSDAASERAKRQGTAPEVYQRIWHEKSSTPRFQKMLQGRMQLPMWAFRQKLLDTIEREQVVIVCGETGCGKSTQVPSFLLEHQLSQGRHCKIYCTEPRRISAISLARRVSEELGEGRGDLGGPRSLVGFSIRLEANTCRETRLVFATTGIVMRMLESSNDLAEITHLVLDEVHERSIDSDFLLIILKKLMKKRADLKVVLMSATVDADRFSKYLGGATVLNVPGRTFPVQVNYLEDAVELTGFTPEQRGQEKMINLDDDDLVDAEIDSSSKPDLIKSLKGKYSNRALNTLQQLDEYHIPPELIVQLLTVIAQDPRYINYSQAILIFLPGIAEIRTLMDFILGHPMFQRDWLVYPLHSTIAMEDQEAAFLIPPPGQRKIVLATNIAETGITIPDVTCVIDTGQHREMRFDERRQLSRLLDTFISRANAKQRRGRAGRVQEGLCFHMFTKYRHDAIMSDQQTPEMLRLSLQDLAIRVKVCKIGGIEDTLNEALDPPSSKNIRRAVDALVDVRALTGAEELTPLGHQLARLPLDVFLGKLILLGTIFKCLDMALTVAAVLSSKSPFVAPFGQRSQADAVRLGFRRGDSDLLTIYNAYSAWKRVCQNAVNASGSGAEMQYCRKNFLSQQNLSNIEDLKGSLLTALVDSGALSMTDEERKKLRSTRGGPRRRGRQVFFEVPHRVNLNSENDYVSQSVMAWSFYPKLLVRDVPGGKGLRNIGNNQNIRLHPSSVNKNHNELRWLSYYHIMQIKSVYNAHETTAVESFPVALLCGDVRCDMYSGVMILDGNRARFSVPDWKTMLVIKYLRTRLREMLTRSFKSPGKLPTVQHAKWLEIWQKIFSQEFKKESSGPTVSTVTMAKSS